MKNTIKLTTKHEQITENQQTHDKIHTWTNNIKLTNKMKKYKTINKQTWQHNRTSWKTH